MKFKKGFLVILICFFCAHTFAQVELVALGILGIASIIKNKSNSNKAEKNQKYHEILEQAQANVNANNFVEAVKKCNEAIDLIPDGIEALMMRGKIFLIKLDKYDNAINDFTEVIKINSNESEAYLNRGVAYFFKKEYQKAIKNYDKFIEIGEQDNLEYKQKNEYNVESYRQFVEDRSKKRKDYMANYTKVYFYKGNAYYYLGNFEEAQNFYNQAKEKDCNEPYLYYNLGNLYLEKLNDVQAIEHYQSAVQLGLKLNIESYNDHLKNAEKFIQNRVEQDIHLWQQKGEFEKTSDYKLRVNENERNKKAQELSKIYLQKWQKIFTTLFFGNNTDFKIVGQYDADNETFLIEHPFIGRVPIKVPVGEAQNFKNDFAQYKISNIEMIPLKDSIIIAKFNINKYVYDNQVAATYATSNIQYNFKPINYETTFNKQITTIGNQNINQQKNIVIGSDEIDINIPQTHQNNEHTYAIVIGNEDYQNYQPNLSKASNVDFAINDAEIFKQYVHKTMGVPETHIHLIKNGTSAQMKREIAWLKQMASVENGNANLLVYYSGHGLPDETSEQKEGYLVPVDVSGTNISDGVKLDFLFQQLGAEKFKKCLIIFDACFSGASKSAVPLYARKGIAIKPKPNMPIGNMVVISSSSQEESSGVFTEKQHGFFTYFFLKHLYNTKGETNIQNLFDATKQNVLKESSLISTPQTPSIQVSKTLSESDAMNWTLNNF